MNTSVLSCLLIIPKKSQKQHTIKTISHNTHRRQVTSESCGVTFLDGWFTVYLTDTPNPKDYIKKMKRRDEELAANQETLCPLVEMIGADGRRRKIQAADTQGLLRLIQSIPSKKAEVTFSIYPEEYELFYELTIAPQNGKKAIKPLCLFLQFEARHNM